MDRWIKMGRACALTDVHRDTMRKWCRDGYVVARKVQAGSRHDWRILESSLPVFTGGLEDKKALVLMRRAGL